MSAEPQASTIDAWSGLLACLRRLPQQMDFPAQRLHVDTTWLHMEHPLFRVRRDQRFDSVLSYTVSRSHIARSEVDVDFDVAVLARTQVYDRSMSSPSAYITIFGQEPKDNAVHAVRLPVSGVSQGLLAALARELMAALIRDAAQRLQEPKQETKLVVRSRCVLPAAPALRKARHWEVQRGR